MVLLATGGFLVYSGPVRESVKYFSEAGRRCFVRYDTQARGLAAFEAKKIHLYNMFLLFSYAGVRVRSLCSVQVVF